MAKTRRRLTELNIDEVSLVDKAANKRTFMIIKRDAEGEERVLLKANTSITIVSDGTAKGTNLTINGSSVSRIHELGFGMYDAEPDNDEGGNPPVMLRYVTSNKQANPAGFKSTKTFIFAKADINEMEKAEWTDAQIKALPDESFLHVDGEVRQFPYKDGNGLVSLPYLRKAIDEIPNAEITDDIRKALGEQARRLLDTAKKFDGEDLKTITEFLGPDAQVGDITDEQAASLAKSLDVLADYSKIAPADAREAIHSLAQMAAISPNAEQVQKEEESNVTENAEHKVEDKPVVEQKTPTFDVDALAAALLPGLEQKVKDTVAAAIAEATPKPNEPKEPEAKEPTGDEDDEDVTVDIDELAEQVADEVAGTRGNENED